MRFTLALIVACFTEVAQAGELLIHTTAWHQDSTYRAHGSLHSYNSITLGIGYTTDNNWMVGLYHNSYREPTVYVAKKFPLFGSDFSAIVGLASGYSIPTDKTVTPMAALNYELRLNTKLSTHFTVVPKVSDDSSASVMLSVGRKF